MEWPWRAALRPESLLHIGEYGPAVATSSSARLPPRYLRERPLIPDGSTAAAVLASAQEGQAGSGRLAVVLLG